MLSSNLIYVFLGGGLGSVIRFLISKYSLQLYSGNFPLGTVITNVISCFLIGGIVFFYIAKDVPLNKPLTFFLIAGFCGGLSTFSTFSFETFELIKQGFYFTAAFNVLLSIAFGLGAIYFMYKVSN